MTGHGWKEVVIHRVFICIALSYRINRIQVSLFSQDNTKELKYVHLTYRRV